MVECRGYGPAPWAGPSASTASRQLLGLGETSCHLSALASSAVRGDHQPLPENGTVHLSA